MNDPPDRIPLDTLPKERTRRCRRTRTARIHFDRLTEVPGTDLQAQLEEGLVLRQRKKFRKAQKIFERLARCDDPSIASQAQIELGNLQGRFKGLVTPKRDDEAGIASYAAAAASGDPEAAPQAAFLLGEIFVRQQKPAEAETALQQAIDSGHPEWFPRAAVKLAGMFRTKDLDKAISLYELVLDRGSGQPATDAAYNLGEICRAQGDFIRAREFYAQSVAIGGNAFRGRDWYLRLPGPRGNPDLILQKELQYLQSKSEGLPPALTPEDHQRVLDGGEQVLVNTSLVTANSNQEALPVILTDRRIQVGGFSSDYRTLQSMTCIHNARKKTRTSTGAIVKTTTHYAYTVYTLINAQGQKVVLQLSENLQNNDRLESILNSVTYTFIDPARAVGVVDLIRSGEKAWRIRKKDAQGRPTGTVVLSLSSTGFMVHVESQPREVAWSEHRGPVLVRYTATTCSVRFRDATESTIESDRFTFSELDFLELALTYCQYELG